MWNVRQQQFRGNTTQTCMWKDVSFNSWIHHHNELTSYLKAINKLDLPSQIAVTSRILYKHKNQMRRDKPFQLIERASKLAKRFVNTGILAHLESYSGIITEMKQCKGSLTKDVCVPSMEYTSFLIELIYATYKLIPCIIDSCEQAHIYLDSHMRYGFFVSFNLFAMASVSRLWSIFKAAKEYTRLVFTIIKDITTNCYTNGFSCCPEIQTILRCDLETKNSQAGSQSCDEEELVGGDGVGSESQELIKPLAEDLGESISRSSIKFPFTDPTSESVVAQVESMSSVNQNDYQCRELPTDTVAFASPGEIDGLGHLQMLKDESKESSYNNKSSTGKVGNMTEGSNKRQIITLGIFRSKRFHHLTPYPTTNAVARSFKIPFHRYKGVRSLQIMRKCYKIIKEQARSLKRVEDVREALVVSASKQETLYLIMRLRKLLEGRDENDLFA